MGELEHLTLPQLKALRRLLDRLIPFSTAVEKRGGRTSRCTSQRTTPRLSSSFRRTSVMADRLSATAPLPRPLRAEHRADLGAAVAAVPRPEARKSSPPKRSKKRAWDGIIAAARRLDDSLLGDFLGALCLAATSYILFVIAGVLS